MKRPAFGFSTLRLAILGTALALGASATPQDQPPAPAGAPSGRQMPSPEEQAARLATRLNLNESQKAALVPILSEQQDQLKRIMGESDGSRRSNFRQMRSVREETDKKIAALLTPDQKKQFEQLRKEQKSNARRRVRG
jgi:Spy/CpxP family protein refolding chaperone